MGKSKELSGGREHQATVDISSWKSCIADQRSRPGGLVDSVETSKVLQAEQLTRNWVEGQADQVGNSSQAHERRCPGVNIDREDGWSGLEADGKNRAVGGSHVHGKEAFRAGHGRAESGNTGDRVKIVKRTGTLAYGNFVEIDQLRGVRSKDAGENQTSHQ